jgi:hypothetical protein
MGIVFDASARVAGIDAWNPGHLPLYPVLLVP